MGLGLGRLLGALASLVVGGTVAAVTITGLISNAVDSPSDQPGNADKAVVPYGTIK